MHGSLTDAGDVLAALRGADALRRLRSIGEACARALLAFEVLASAHT